MNPPIHSQAGTVQEIMAEHRQCGPGFDGCYSHWPTPHCRADGMAWPCDVDAIRVVIGPHIHPPGETDKRCAECYRARAAPDPEPLRDVEWLAEAMANVTGLGVNDTEHGREFDIEGARRVLAEYQRIAGAAPDPEPPPPALVCPDCGHYGSAHSALGHCSGSLLAGGECLCIRMWPIEPEPPSEHLAEKVQGLERGLTEALRAAPDPEGLPSVDVDVLRDAALDVESGYINRPDRTTRTYWSKIAARYEYLAARLSPVEPTDKGEPG